MIFLSIDKRDTIDLTVNANYERAPTGNAFLGTAYDALFSSFDAAYGSGVENGVSSSSSVFDEALNGIDMSGKGNSSTAAQGIGMHQTISLSDIIADQEGYILAYLSDENAEEVAIHWDDFTVYHGKTNVVQAQAYYPYGGRFDQYQRTASTKNVFLYNEGAERLEDFSFNLDETKHQIYDPWGRLGWWQIDPKADLDINVSWSSYNYAYSNSIRYNDPLSDCPKCLEGLKRLFIDPVVNARKSAAKKQAVFGSGTRLGPTKNITGNYFGDAAFKLAGGETLQKALDGVLLSFMWV
ncbi:MAG: hypothetical protein AAGI25_19290 [Bacteroidota bacterium]